MKSENFQENGHSNEMVILTDFVITKHKKWNVVRKDKSKSNSDSILTTKQVIKSG